MCVYRYAFFATLILATSAAADFTTAWQLGDDDSQTAPFSQESFGSNPAPGSANLKDDDYYFAGNFAPPIGVLAANETITFVERALTAEDPRNRFHFLLTTAQASAQSRFRITVDLFGGATWINGSIPGFSQHNVTVTFNGQTIGTVTDLVADRMLIITVPASAVNAVNGANTLQVERTGGGLGGYIQMDYLKLEVDIDGLTDSDSDGMPRWFERAYSLNDTDPSDAQFDPDADLVNNLTEFQAGTNPTDPDSDNDGLTDRQEILLGSNPRLADTDGDGLLDGAETQSNPLLADSDSDSFPDNIEIEQGTNPLSSASVPFIFPGVIGLQFVCERLTEAKLGTGEPAGFLRFPNWNASAPLPGWAPSGTLLNGSQSNLKDQRGQVTTAAASWTYHFAQPGLHKGPSNERLLDGMIRTERTAAVNNPVVVNLTGIPYPTYDLIVYVGKGYPGSRGVIRCGSNLASSRYFLAASAPPFAGWQEITAASESAITAGNYVRYRNLTGATQYLTLASLESVDPTDSEKSVAIHGLQIINSGADTDGDGIKDIVEIEKNLNPALADANLDPDADGMTNAAEIAAGTDPKRADTDGDRLPDGAEIAAGTSPLNPDSDGDQLADGDEINFRPFPSSPTLADSDGDSFNDFIERAHGSDPLSNTSVPPSVPLWDAASHTWRWRVENLRVLWNHDQSMLGAIESNDAMLFEAVADINQSGWTRQIGMGIRLTKGKLVHRFRAIGGAFRQSTSLNDGFWTSDWNTNPLDRTRDLGFSGHGNADDSHPLRLEFTAVQQFPSNVWSLRFEILNISDLANPISIASYTAANAVAADATLLDGTAVWKNQNGVAGQIELATETGVSAYITRNPLGLPDADNDGMPDAWETLYNFNPNSPVDALLDADLDGLSNLKEYLAGTLPRNSDSDGDGVSDAIEINQGSNPKLASSKPTWFAFTGKIDDLDGDGISDAWVLWSGGKRRLANLDDDGDGVSNLDESNAGTNPDDAKSRIELKGWRDANNFMLSWTDTPYKLSRISVSNSLTDWQLATILPVSGVVPGRRQVTLANEFTANANTRFYRVGVQPIDTDGDGVEDWVEKNVLDSSLSNSASLGQPLTRSNGQVLSGDARALLDRLQGSAATGGTSGTTAVAMPSAVSASRFLMQASFGPTLESIQQVRQLGYEGWINQQIAQPVSLLQPYITEIKADGAGKRLDRSYNFNEMDKFVNGNNATTPFARNAVRGEDQLRQRVAFALSQILVVSRRAANLEEKPEAIAHYYDTLSRRALGNYGDLLREVTFHPAMGWYLSHAGNQKADPSIPRYPDENYAREIMQLFSIGLWQLNPDGSRKLDPLGEPIPTYDNGDVTELARAFTGLYFAAPYGWGGGGWDDAHYLVPMVMYPERHDFGSKKILSNIILPAKEASEANAVQEVRDAVDGIFRHPNTPPFVCRQLIQFLITDNPSPAYIRRIQDVFVNDGNGVRGNLAAVVKAILLDSEARSLPLSASYGKVREPVIRTMHLGRLFHLAESSPNFVWWNWPDTFYAYTNQEPMNSPSVFNFYTPVYQAPGEIRNSGLVSPGFQIVNTYSAISLPNVLWDYLKDGFVTGSNKKYPFDYREFLLLAENPNALIDQLDLLICAGNLKARTRAIMLNALSNPSLSSQDRVALAVWIAMICPEGVVQK